MNECLTTLFAIALAMSAINNYGRVLVHNLYESSLASNNRTRRLPRIAVA
ncbi:hypothetical protein Hanom_Chr11g00969061 [Helianthus anomalus]